MENLSYFVHVASLILRTDIIRQAHHIVIRRTLIIVAGSVFSKAMFMVIWITGDVGVIGSLTGVKLARNAAIS